MQLLICNNFCLTKFFVQCIFKALFGKKSNCAIRAEAKPVGQSKKFLYQKLRIVTYNNFCLKKKFCTTQFQGTFRQKTELCSQGRDHTHGPILLICNVSRELYHIKLFTKFGCASSIIFWVIVLTDRQTVEDPSRRAMALYKTREQDVKWIRKRYVECSVLSNVWNWLKMCDEYIRHFSVGVAIEKRTVTRKGPNNRPLASLKRDLSL